MKLFLFGHCSQILTIFKEKADRTRESDLTTGSKIQAEANDPTVIKVSL